MASNKMGNKLLVDASKSELSIQKLNIYHSSSVLSHTTQIAMMEKGTKFIPGLLLTYEAGLFWMDPSPFLLPKVAGDMAPLEKEAGPGDMDPLQKVAAGAGDIV